MSSDDPSCKAPVVTLDGLSGSGKSTLARRLAGALDWFFVDSGAWYRALTWATLGAGIDRQDPQQVLDVLSQIEIAGLADGSVMVDERALGTEIRTPEVDAAVSDIADHTSVRERLNLSMRSMRLRPDLQGLVADGRDAGSVIFPDASLKVYVDVPLAERARRRCLQFQANGLDRDLAQVQAALAERDQRESQRGSAAPRIHAGDRVLHNESLTVEEAIRQLLEWVRSL